MNVKDAISAVVSSMKPTIPVGSFIVSGGGTTITGTDIDLGITSKLFVGERVKLTYSGSAIYGSITSISGGTVVITPPVTKLIPPSAIEIVLVFDHGHPTECVNRVKEYTHHDTLKFESFPRILLFHDFEEKVTYETAVSLNVVILTDTSPTYTTPQRYTYSFDPILTPLYDLFLRQLADSANIVSTEANYFKHTKIDRLYWGKNGLYGNTANVFDDFIDAIELVNLELILNNC